MHILHNRKCRVSVSGISRDNKMKTLLVHGSTPCIGPSIQIGWWALRIWAHSLRPLGHWHLRGIACSVRLHLRRSGWVVASTGQRPNHP